MRMIKTLCLSVLMISSVNLLAQTPEQQKQIEEMQKNAEKMMEQAQRQYDSIKNTPEMKKAREQNEEFARMVEERAKEKEKEKKESISNTSEISRVDYLISKGTATRFENWTYGEAELVLLGMASSSNSPGYSVKIGTINTGGNFNFELPEDLKTFVKVIDNRWINCSPGSGSNQKWTNPGAGILEPTLRIMKNGKDLGNIFWASSIEVIEGWTTTNDYHGIPGHRMKLVYVSATSKSEVVCKIERRYGNGKDFDLYKKINIEFIKGWNLVKTTYSGERILIDWGEGAHNKHNYYKDEKITAVKDLSSETKWIFIPY